MTGPIGVCLVHRRCGVHEFSGRLPCVCHPLCCTEGALLPTGRSSDGAVSRQRGRAGGDRGAEIFQGPAGLRPTVTRPVEHTCNQQRHRQNTACSPHTSVIHRGTPPWQSQDRDSNTWKLFSRDKQLLPASKNHCSESGVPCQAAGGGISREETPLRHFERSSSRASGPPEEDEEIRVAASPQRRGASGHAGLGAG